MICPRVRNLEKLYAAAKLIIRSIAQVIKDENGRPFIVVREYVALRWEMYNVNHVLTHSTAKERSKGSTAPRP